MIDFSLNQLSALVLHIIQCHLLIFETTIYCNFKLFYVQICLLAFFVQPVTLRIFLGRRVIIVLCCRVQ